MKILLIGKNGQVGKNLKKKFSKYENFVSVSRKEIDLKNKNTVYEKIKSYEPDVIINAAAYTNVDLAEINKEEVFLVNYKSIKEIARYAYENSALLVHYSSDYVFDGSKEKPYTEEDKTNPLNIYGNSKLKAENAIISSNCKHLIIRTSWVYSNEGKNFPNTILNLAKRQESISIVNDQFGAPTHTDLISEVTYQLINKNSCNGLFHLTSSGEVSWFQFASYLINGTFDRGINLKCSVSNIFPILSDKSLNKAIRPKNSVLNCDKIKKIFNDKIPEWQYHADKFLDNWIKNYEKS